MPYPPAAPPRNGFGITALVLALIGLVFSLIPLTGFIALILGGLAVLFGLLGVARTRKGVATNKIMSWIGTGLGGLSLVVGIVGMVIVFQAADQFVRDMDKISDDLQTSPGSAQEGIVPASPLTETAAPAQNTGPLTSGITDGMYHVGEDIEPGTYKSAGGDGRPCFWARYKNGSSEFANVITSNLNDGPARVTVKSGELLEISGCQPFEKVG